MISLKSERSENAATRVSLQIKSEKRAELRKPRNEASYGISEFFRGLRHERLQSSLPFLLFLRRNLKELEGEREKENKKGRKISRTIGKFLRCNLPSTVYLRASYIRDICVFPQKLEF